MVQWRKVCPDDYWQNIISDSLIFTSFFLSDGKQKKLGLEFGATAEHTAADARHTGGRWTCILYDNFQVHILQKRAAQRKRPANVPREIYNLYTHTANEESLQAQISGAEQPPANKPMHKSVRYFTIMFFLCPMKHATFIYLRSQALPLLDNIAAHSSLALEAVFEWGTRRRL